MLLEVLPMVIWYDMPADDGTLVGNTSLSYEEHKEQPSSLNEPDSLHKEMSPIQSF